MSPSNVPTNGPNSLSPSPIRYPVAPYYTSAVSSFLVRQDLMRLLAIPAYNFDTGTITNLDWHIYREVGSSEDYPFFGVGWRCRNVTQERGGRLLP